MDKIQRKRKELLRRICTDMKSDNRYYHQSKEANTSIINDDYNILYCSIPKVGCTNWKRIFLVLSGVRNSTLGIHHFAVHAHKYPTISRTEHRRQNYTSFLFVRHPFQRLLSAYRNKFEIPDNKAFVRTGRKIISLYRSYATTKKYGNTLNPRVKFPEFVRFLLNSENKSSFNVHWDFQHKLCAVCDHSYDFIGHFENIVEESNYFLHSIGVTNVSFPNFSTHATNSSDENIYLKYFSQIPPDDIIKLYELYKMDFKLFGYPFPQELF
uniref:Carbohydrate sulfotransferase n=1 Tax=Saccoglossus kowalevskii TaxID=10224 RepID=A0ABM0M731_SACKO|nr:PREDICTED: carbohydrate sulfotransferase 8-like [Saccoglossus kowalevskii]